MTAPTACEPARFATVTVTLAEPFRRAGGTVDRVRQVFARVEVDGVSGHGCAVLATPGAHRIAREMAEIDARARRAGKSAAACLGVPSGSGQTGTPLTTAVTLGAGPMDEVVANAVRLVDWPIVKLKVGPASAPDLAEAVRAVYPGRIWVDANASLDVTAARRLLPRLAAAGVELLEQPLPRSVDLQILRGEVRNGPRLVADEDCRAPGDVSRLSGRVDVVNVKVNKCGGLRNAHRTAAAARAAGIQVMIGSNTSSMLATAAAAQLATPGDLLDLDGHLGLVDDPFEGVTVRAGSLVTRSLGFGADPRWEVCP